MSSARRIAGKLTGIISAAATWPLAASLTMQTHLREGGVGCNQKDLPGCGKSSRTKKKEKSQFEAKFT